MTFPTITAMFAAVGGIVLLRPLTDLLLEGAAHALADRPNR